ncbi:Zn(II)2Cys6 transcription factor domain-containing protein [Aspergillus undulatus]|uniref:Zn(II)2Cys6 transcription factor domain-containing protein n=1 Tax=Aspergillus undulatus TaxID=1810928 RepID=UPI003CCE374B
MFGTLHWNSQDQEAKFVERPHGSSNLEKNSACDRCRAKKVKCSTGEDGCSRCKRLGKKCTFRSIKHTGGNRRLRKGSVSTPQHERTLDFFIQSPAHPTSPQNTRHDELGPSPPADGDLDMDDNIIEQHHISNLPAHMDFPFLNGAEFCEQTAPQDGDEFPITTSALPSSPFLSTLLPSSSIWSTGIFSPPFSAHEDISPLLHHLPPAQDVPSLNPISFFPTHTPSSSQPCQCIAAVIFAVEEAETSCNSGSRSELDSIIAYQKEAIKRCCLMLKCSTCLPKRENVVLLAFMAEKLVAAMSQIVVLYRKKECTKTNTLDINNNSTKSNDSNKAPNNANANIDHDFSQFLSLEDDRWHDLPGAFTLPSTSTSPTTSASTSASTSISHLNQLFHPVPRPGLPNWREMLLGDYEISSSMEWEHIMRVLITLQIWGVIELLAGMRAVCGDALGETQMASLASAERRLVALSGEV